VWAEGRLDLGPSGDSGDQGGALLAVDLGLRTGLALYADDGRLRRYRSQHFGSRDALRRAASRALDEAGDLRHLVVEGDAALARIWGRAAQRAGAAVHPVTAERWRGALLHPSQRRDPAAAKRSADRLARAVIEWSGAARPTSLRHDAAEAICIGLWGVQAVGWLVALPPEIDPARRGA
jgi:hypothetical protein